MQTSDIRIAIRHLWQNKLYSAINVLGLSVGIACVLLAVLYWQDERSFDQFHKKNPDLYRITTTLAENKSSQRVINGGTGQVQGPAFKAEVPEVLDYTRVLGGGIASDVRAGAKTLHLQTFFADDNFFRLFTFPLVHGDAQTALGHINSVVVTESAAARLFNSTDVVGKQIELDADPSAQRLGKPMVITAVVKNLPVNSSIQFDLLLPLTFLQLSFEDNNWLNAYLGTFVLLNPNANNGAVIEKFHRVYSSRAKEQLTQNMKTYGFDPQISYGLQPLTDMHLHPLASGMESGMVNGSNPVFSYLFMGIALFILLMASINFINISIADSLKRAKEVGVRKIIGGSRMQIIMHFLFESALLCLVAFVFALLVVSFALPLFNDLAAKQISFANAFRPKLLLDILALLGVIVLITGLYPAWVLSGFNATAVLYNKQRLSGRNAFGKVLVVFQFSLAVFLLIATLVYSSQMNYVRTKQLGYDPHEVVQSKIPGNRDHGSINALLKSALAKEPAIESVSFGGGENAYEVRLRGRTVEAIHKVIDENYLSVLNIPLKAGRNFSMAFPSDSSRAVLVNEAFVRAAALENPLGVQIQVDENFDKVPKIIVGVIKDYHIRSLREPIRPMVLFMSSWYGEDILARLQKTRVQQGLSRLENAYKTAMPQAVYEYHFLDDLNAKQYEQENRWQWIISIATALSVAICCLGLFGLAHLAANQRLKEIGIRKVLGASISQLVQLLSARFLLLVIVAILIASPLAWYVMSNWLQGFAYRTHLGLGIFIVADFIAISVALMAVSFQAIRAASVNPVKNLRTE